MKVVHVADLPEQNINSPLFTGPVTSRAAVTDRDAQFNVAYIHFPEGVRNKFHTHSNDQVLIVTEGRGMVATEHEEVAIAAGDVAFIPAGETHRHGAVPGSPMTHISILPANTKTEQVGE